MSCYCQCRTSAQHDALVRSTRTYVSEEQTDLPKGQFPPETGTQVPVRQSAPYGPANAMLQLKVGAEAPPVMTAAIYGALSLLLEAHTRARSPLTVITEWYRSATANLALAGQGAVANSQHQVGTAFDLRADAGGEATARWWQELGGQTIDERNVPGVAPHWHLELRNPARVPSIDV